MLDGDGNNKKSNSKLGDNLGLAKQSSGSKNGTGGMQRTLNRDRSKELEESWGSLQLQAEQMLGNPGGDIEDETSPFDKKAAASSTNVSVGTASAAAQHKIEEEIIAEEIRLAQQSQQQSAQKKSSFTRRRSSDMNADMVEDFENEYLDEEAFKDEKGAGDDGIVDEVEEEDALRMIDEEIMNTAIAKHDARKLKDLIQKIDGAGPRGSATSSEKNTPDSGKNSVGSATDQLTNSGSFKSVKPVDQQTKFSSSSKVVVSKYSKTSSKQNLHESNSIFAGRRTPSDKKIVDNEPEEQEEPEDHRLEPLGGSEDDIDEFIKRHLQDEESKSGSAGASGSSGIRTEEEKDAMLAKAKELLGEGKIPPASLKTAADHEAEMMEEPLSDSDGSEDMDGE